MFAKQGRLLRPFVAALLSCICVSVFPPVARGDVPTGVPVFSNPTAITNPYFPFTPGDVKVYRGRSGKAKLAATDHYLSETRVFAWNGGAVETRIVREIEFRNGKLVEIAMNHFAQADDGTVYYFGETVDDYASGGVVSHDGSWLVGGATLPGDPVDTAVAVNPTVFMPANPEVGDQFKPDDLLPYVDETATVESKSKTVKVEAGKFKNVMRIKLTSVLPDSDPERKWHAPGVGVIRMKESGEVLNLIATTQIAVAPRSSD